MRTDSETSRPEGPSWDDPETPITPAPPGFAIERDGGPVNSTSEVLVVRPPKHGDDTERPKR